MIGLITRYQRPSLVLPPSLRTPKHRNFTGGIGAWACVGVWAELDSLCRDRSLTVIVDYEPSSGAQCLDYLKSLLGCTGRWPDWVTGQQLTSAICLGHLREVGLATFITTWWWVGPAGRGESQTDSAGSLWESMGKVWLNPLCNESSTHTSRCVSIRSQDPLLKLSQSCDHKVSVPISHFQAEKEVLSSLSKHTANFDLQVQGSHEEGQDSCGLEEILASCLRKGKLFTNTIYSRNGERNTFLLNTTDTLRLCKD